MATQSLGLWQQFATQTGEQTGFKRCGLLYLSNNEKELAGWARWGEFARTVDVKTCMLTAQQATERGKVTGKHWKGGVLHPLMVLLTRLVRPLRSLAPSWPWVAPCIRAARRAASKLKVADCPRSSLRMAPSAPGSPCSQVALGHPRFAVSMAFGFPRPLFVRQ